MHAYTLTDLTGRRRNEGRTATKAGFEYNRRHAIIVGVAAGASLPVSLIVFLLVGPVAFVVIPVLFIIAGFVGFEMRSRKGLKQRLYRSVRDKMTADVDRIYICGQPVETAEATGRIVASSRPALAGEARDVFDGSAVTVRRAPVITGRRDVAATSVGVVLDGEV